MYNVAASKKFVINGLFLDYPVTGIQRYALEIVKELDKVVEPGRFIILAPLGNYQIPSLQNIEIIKTGRHKKIAWEQLDLARYIRKHNEVVCVNLCNTKPILTGKGVTFVYDIMCKVTPQFFTSPRDRIASLYHIIQYARIARTDSIIVTVSNYSKTDILREYPLAKEKVEIIYPGWQHILEKKENPNFFDDYSFVRDGEYYFAMSARSKNKNSEWIEAVAKNNPNSQFIIAGNNEKQSFNNIHYVGYISDSDVVSFMRHCKAFLFPSFYEGFGLPPLEAVALGAKIIVSNTASLPEVFGENACYIDPNDSEVDLEKILLEYDINQEKLLSRYSWKSAAEQLNDLLINKIDFFI